MTDPENISWIRIILACAVVSGLLALLGLGLRYAATHRFGFSGLKTSMRRLSILETLPLDARRRLVLIRRDGTEHLILLGHNQDIVVEANLSASKNTGRETGSPN